MGTTTGIEWTDATWNPWVGCTAVSPACDNCYMFDGMRRYGRDPETVVRTKPGTFRLPLHKDSAGNFKIPAGSRVFTCSWSDWFHQGADEWRDGSWEIIRQRPDVTFQILTKRPRNIEKRLPSDWGDGYPNVWLGVTVENQQWADNRLPVLIDIPAALRFVSYEPATGPVRMRKYLSYLGWVIAGGESGKDSRPIHPDWMREVKEDCRLGSVPFFFKQWGEWWPIHGSGVPTGHEEVEFKPFAWIDHSGRTRDSGCEPDALMLRVGKKRSGRLLDGREYSQFPGGVKWLGSQ